VNRLKGGFSSCLTPLCPHKKGTKLNQTLLLYNHSPWRELSGESYPNTPASSGPSEYSGQFSQV